MKVKIQTMLGDIVARLYDETPIHRDNFVKLAKEGYYDGTPHLDGQYPVFGEVEEGLMWLK